MRIRLAVPANLNRDEQAASLDAALESVTRAAEAQIARGAPLATDAIAAGVRWKPEPPGDEHFDLPNTIIKRGWGDCDDLAPYHAASLRITGEDPEAVARVYPSGPHRWHAVVQRSDGSIDDPSKWAGMRGVDGADAYGGPFWPAMFDDRLALATYPLNQGWAGRVDLPSATVPAAYSALTHARNPRRAAMRAIMGACHVAEDDADERDVLRLAGLHDILLGEDPEVVGEALAQQAGIGFLPVAAALAPAAMSLASPVLSKILPGGGGKASPPAASAAPGGDSAPGRRGGGGGGGIMMPNGPIIVRF